MTDEKSDAPLPLPDAAGAEARAAASATPSRGLLKVILLGPRAWKRWWLALVRSVGHEHILAKAEEDASFNFNYAFMVAVS